MTVSVTEQVSVVAEISSAPELIATENGGDTVALSNDRVQVLQTEERATLAVEISDSSVVAVSESPELVVHEVERVLVLSAGSQGPAGIQGTPGVSGSSYVTYTANGAIGGHRAVRPVFDNEVAYADNSATADANVVLGITIGAAVNGADVNVQTTGEMVEPSWDWTIDQPVFVGAAGVLTQTVPTSGFLLIVGIATAPTKLLIGIKQPIVL